MKILHIIGSVDKKLGGTYTALYSIMNIEQYLGYSNEVISTTSMDQQYDNFFNKRIHFFERTFPRRFRFSKYGLEWLKANIKNYDLIVFHELWGGFAAKAAIMAIKVKIKYIIWPHGSLDPFDLRKKKLLKQFLGRMIIRRIIANAEVVCCTSALEKQLLETYGTTPKKIEILPLPVDYNEKGDGENFRNRYGIAENSFVFLFLSRIDYKKGLGIFLAALGNYLKDNPMEDIKFVIAGTGTKSYQDVIRKIILEHDLSDFVINAGFLSGDNKANAFAGSDCFVLTSMNENYGISIIEALQAGLPVIISNKIYIWEKIIPEGGWLCDYSIDSIERTFEQIFNSNEQLKKYPKKAGDQFSTNSLIKDYKNFYKSLGLTGK